MSSSSDDAQRVQEIRARLEAATPGPWGYNSYSGVFGPPELCAADDGPDYPESPRPMPGSPEDRVWLALRSAAYEADPRVCKVPALYGDTAIGRHAADAEFIAHAREDVPYLLARLDALEDENRALVEDNTALRWKNGDSYDTWPLARLREPEYFKVGDRELEKTAVCRCCDASWAWSYVSPEGYCLHCVDGRADIRAERDALKARAERAEAAYLDLVAGDARRFHFEDCMRNPDNPPGHSRDECVSGAVELAAAALAGSREQATGEGE